MTPRTSGAASALLQRAFDPDVTVWVRERYDRQTMYAVIKTGGKQYRVEEGQRLNVERLNDDSEDLSLTPVMVFDGDTVLATPEQLGGGRVWAGVVGEGRGKKIDGFTYKNKSNNRRRYGHRQSFSTIEIVGISR